MHTINVMDAASSALADLDGLSLAEVKALLQEKYAELAIAGWRLIRVTGKQVKNGQALQWIERAL